MLKNLNLLYSKVPQGGASNYSLFVKIANEEKFTMHQYWRSFEYFLKVNSRNSARRYLLPEAGIFLDHAVYFSTEEHGNVMMISPHPFNSSQSLEALERRAKRLFVDGFGAPYFKSYDPSYYHPGKCLTLIIGEVPKRVIV